MKRERMAELFNKAYEGLKAQNTFGFDYEGNTCEYMTESGNRCAIGFLLTESEAASMPSYGLSYLATSGIINDETPETIVEIISDDDAYEFFKDLQAIHDNCAESCDHSFRDCLAAMESHAQDWGVI